MESAALTPRDGLVASLPAPSRRQRIHPLADPASLVSTNLSPHLALQSRAA